MTVLRDLDKARLRDFKLGCGMHVIAYFRFEGSALGVRPRTILDFDLQPQVRRFSVQEIRTTQLQTFPSIQYYGLPFPSLSGLWNKA